MCSRSAAELEPLPERLAGLDFAGRSASSVVRCAIGSDLACVATNRPHNRLLCHRTEKRTERPEVYFRHRGQEFLRKPWRKLERSKDELERPRGGSARRSGAGLRAENLPVRSSAAVDFPCAELGNLGSFFE